MVNNIVLVGRTCADVEERFLPNGTMVARFTLAVDRNRKDANGQKLVDFIRCSAFSKTAEFLSQFVHKGRLIAVEGSLHINSVAQADGTNRTYAEVTANSVQALDYEKQETTIQREALQTETYDSDVPF